MTGAGQGIGRAIAERLAADGATVIVTDLSEDTAARTAGDIGGPAVARHTDVTSPASVAALTDWVLSEFGRIDVLVNKVVPADRLLAEAKEWVAEVA